METAEYWPMAREYGIWNAAITSLQFWAEDLDPITLGIASKQVYTTFFWTSTSHTLCQLSEEAVFGRFVLALNAAFTQQLSLADEGLWEWFQQWLTYTFMKNTMHTPCFQYGTCILWSCPHYAMPPSWYSLLWHTAIPTQTSMPPPNVPFWQFREWPDPDTRQLTRQLIRWGGRFPNSTYWWWTLDNRNGTRKNILHTWRWVTKQCMSISMPLWE